MIYCLFLGCKILEGRLCELLHPSRVSMHFKEVEPLFHPSLLTQRPVFGGSFACDATWRAYLAQCSLFYGSSFNACSDHGARAWRYLYSQALLLSLQAAATLFGQRVAVLFIRTPYKFLNVLLASQSSAWLYFIVKLCKN